MNAPANPRMVVASLDDIRDVVRQVLIDEREAIAGVEAEPLLLTCSKLCKKLGVSRASIFRWRGEGMPSIRAGDEYRYVLDEVMAWLRGRSSK